MPITVLLRETDPRWQAEVDAAKAVPSSPAYLEARMRGIRVDPDADLCRVQSKHQAEGFVMAEIYRNVHGWCVRDVNNNGQGRMSDNYATRAEALAWAQAWYDRAPDRRRLIARFNQSE